MRRQRKEGDTYKRVFRILPRKQPTGGLHAPAFWKCFFMSAGWIFCGMAAGSFIINHSVALAGVLMGGSALFILKTGISPSSKHRKLSEQSKRKRKYAALFLEACFWVIVACGNKSIIGKGVFVGTVVTRRERGASMHAKEVIRTLLYVWFSAARAEGLSGLE